MRASVTTLRAWAVWLPLIVIVDLVCLLPPAHAFDHGFDPDSPLTQFFDQLQRPICPSGLDKCFCCGKADAYAIVIDQEATIDGDELDGIAHVTDGSALKFPDETTRTAIADGTVFRFRGKDVTKLKQGNPTNTAWAFLGTTLGGAITNVWCVVPLPPSF